MKKLYEILLLSNNLCEQLLETVESCPACGLPIDAAAVNVDLDKVAMLKAFIETSLMHDFE